MKRKYNPYEDRTIHTTQPEPIRDRFDRQAFNDVIRHIDAVNGFQNPKQMNQIPKGLRRFVKWAIIVHVGFFFGSMVKELFDNLKHFFLRG